MAQQESKVPLQAVVLADSFGADRLQPLTWEAPLAQIRLLGASLLQHTLSLLARNGVEEVFLVCTSDSAAAVASTPSGGMHVHTILADGAVSVGDALRAVDSRNVIRSDFVLVRAGCVGAASLQRMLDTHRARRKKDKLCIATISCKQTSQLHKLARSGRQALTPIVALDASSERLLQWEEGCAKLSTSDGSLCIDGDAAGESYTGSETGVRVLYDVEDCGVDVCAPDMLWAFTDNFDWQHLRADFVSGTLKEPELGHKLHAHFLNDDEQVWTVADFRSYDAVAQDLTRRLAYPFCLDNPLSWTLHSMRPLKDTNEIHTRQKHLVYTGQGASGCSSTVISGCSVIFNGAHIGENSYIKNSVIETGSEVASNAWLERCYIGRNVRIGPYVKADGAVICDNAIVHENSHIRSNCVLCCGTQLQSNRTLPAGSRLSQRYGYELDDKEDEIVAKHSAGEDHGSKVFEWQVKDHFFSYRDSLLPIGHDSLEDLKQVLRDDSNHDDSDEAEIFETRNEALRGNKRTNQNDEAVHSGVNSIDEHENGENTTMGEADFAKEVIETVLRCIDERDERNIFVELQSLKLAEDRTFGDLARFAIIALLGLALPPPPSISSEYRSMFATEVPSGQKAMLSCAKRKLESWSPLLQRFLKDDEDQVEVLLTLEEYCSEEDLFESYAGSAFKSIFPQLLKLLYAVDIVGDTAFLRWEEEKQNADESEKEYLHLAAPFLSWLKVCFLGTIALLDFIFPLE